MFLKLSLNTNCAETEISLNLLHVHLLCCILAVELLLHQGIIAAGPNNLKCDIPESFSLQNLQVLVPSSCHSWLSLCCNRQQSPLSPENSWSGASRAGESLSCAPTRAGSNFRGRLCPLPCCPESLWLPCPVLTAAPAQPPLALGVEQHFFSCRAGDIPGGPSPACPRDHEQRH